MFKRLKDLQTRPYQERIRIFRIAFALLAILIIFIWIITLKYRKVESSPGPSKFQEVFENLKRLKELKIR